MARRIAVARLRHQFLLGKTPFTTAADVVRALGAVQSQDYAGAKWALAIRAHGLTDADVDRAVDSGEVLRTHVLRPTWHFVAPEDLRWMLALTSDRIRTIMRSSNRKLGLEETVLRRGNQVIARAIAKQGHLTRAQLRTALDRARIPTQGDQRLARLVMNAELDAVICSGPRVGKQFTYGLVEERAPKPRMLSVDEALLELTRRYFRTHTPATIQDFAWWSGLAIRSCKRGIEMAGRELTPMVIDGLSYWTVDGFELPTTTPTSAHLLPNYDEYFIGYRDRSAIAHRLGDVDPVTGGNALITHVVVIDGQLVGKWKRLQERGATVLQMELLTRLTAAERKRIDQCVDQFEQFIGTAVHRRISVAGRTAK